jgi:hypothetical protein
MGNAHLPVIDHVGEVKGRPPVGTHDNKVIQFLEFEIAEYFVPKGLGKGDEIGLDPHCVLLFGQDAAFDFFEGKAATLSIVFVDLCLLWFFFVIVLAETGIGHAALQQLLLDRLVNGQSFALDVGAEFPFLLDGFIRHCTDPLQSFEDVLQRTCNFSILR